MQLLFEDGRIKVCGFGNDKNAENYLYVSYAENYLHVSYVPTREDLQQFSNDLVAYLNPVEVITEPDPLIHNPLALGDDALGENHAPHGLNMVPCQALTQADGLGDDSQVPEVVNSWITVCD